MAANQSWSHLVTSLILESFGQQHRRFTLPSMAMSYDESWRCSWRYDDEGKGLCIQKMRWWWFLITRRGTLGSKMYDCKLVFSLLEKRQIKKKSVWFKLCMYFASWSYVPKWIFVLQFCTFFCKERCKQYCLCVMYTWFNWNEIVFFLVISFIFDEVMASSCCWLVWLIFQPTWTSWKCLKISTQFFLFAPILIILMYDGMMGKTLIHVLDSTYMTWWARASTFSSLNLFQA
jgi:hypothetical protein